jgi:hypothetical protein
MKKLLLISAALLSLKHGYGQCPTPTLVTATPSVICADATTSLNATAGGYSINWYTVAVSGSPLGASISAANFTVNPSTTTTYYAESFLPASTTFSYTGNLQQFIVPTGVTQITITAIGAAGGSLTANGLHLGGMGASMQGVFTVVPGNTLNIIVGGKGNNDPSSSGGGGASGVANGNTPLIVAGGGAGVDFQAATYAGRHAVTTTGGVVGGGGGGAAGVGGSDGGDITYSSVHISRGGRGWNFNNAGSFGLNGQSASTTTTSGTWGLGGGGGSVGYGFCNCGGGGGGYSGGGSGGINNTGGGGGSYNSGTSQVNTVMVGAGSGSVIITAVGCISASRTAVTVSVNPNPTVAVNSGSICSGNSFTISPSGANTYTIQGGNAVVSPNINSTYTVAGTSTAGCKSQVVTSTVTVNALPLPTVSVNSGSICSGSSFTMVPTGASTYTFQGGNAVVSPTANASYTVVGTNSAGCVSNTFATSSITVQASPSVSVTGAGTICIGQATVLTASGANTYSWNTGATTASILVSPSVTTSYTTTGTSSVTGCSGITVTNLVVSSCAGVTNIENEIEGLSIYPNPSNGNFTIELNNGKTKQIVITDNTGKMIKTMSTKDDVINVSLDQFANGIYHVKVESNNATKVVKISKQ